MKIKTGRLILEPTEQLDTDYNVSMLMVDGKRYKVIKEETDWTPKVGDLVYLAAVTTSDGVLSSMYYPDKISRYRLELNLCFPHTEQGKQMAIARSQEIVSLIKNNLK